MTTQLPERLRALADEAPGPFSPTGLWHERLRRHRTRVVTAVGLVAAVVALTVGGWYGDTRSRQPDPAAPPPTESGPMSIPIVFTNRAPGFRRRALPAGWWRS